MPRSIHDNYVVGHSVDVRDRSIVIRTEKRELGQAVELTNIRFDGVLGYVFRDSLGGILLDVYAIDWDTLRRDYAVLFEAWDKWAWPFQGCLGDPAEHAKASGATAFQIDSAIGFEGFVVSRSMIIEAAQQAPAADGASRRG
jgi:hypothetical protein